MKFVTEAIQPYTPCGNGYFSLLDQRIRDAPTKFAEMDTRAPPRSVRRRGRSHNGCLDHGLRNAVAAFEASATTRPFFKLSSLY